MSLDATTWAWRQQGVNSSQKLVLLALADIANPMNEYRVWPSVARLEQDTCLNRKTIIRCMGELVEKGKLEDMHEFAGKTKRIKVYRLIGVASVHDYRQPETVPKTEQSQKRNDSTFTENQPETVPKTVLPNSPKNGTQNSTTGNSTERTVKHTGRQGDRNRVERFDEFWKTYPRKVKKPKALDIWKRRNLDEHADDIIADVEARKRSDPDWLESTRLIPHPTSYLNAERWTDEWRPQPVRLVHSSGGEQDREAFIRACVQESQMDPRSAAEYADERFKRLGRYFG